MTFGSILGSIGNSLESFFGATIMSVVLAYIYMTSLVASKPSRQDATLHADECFQQLPQKR